MHQVYQADLFPRDFYRHLPRFMACSDDFGNTVHLMRAAAMAKPYIAPNPKAMVWCDVFDIDRPGGAVAWADANLPPPNWTAQNPANAHAHVGYILTHPVPRTPAARLRPIRLLARVEHSMTQALGADRAYAHLLTKTPMHPRWRTEWPRIEPYTLDELREWLPDDLPLRIPKREAVGIGRNVTLFDGLRHWAYRARLGYRAYTPWLDACYTHASALNTFTAPLPASEVRSTARSVAKWVWPRFSAEAFGERQRQRQARWTAKMQARAIDRAAQLFEMR